MSSRLEPAPSVLYVVGTPIGHLGDLSPRARSVLKKVSIIACEDTRHSGQLLNQIKVEAPLISFHKHNTQNRLPKLLDVLKQGQSLALISDAGLPGISDPGQELVSAAREAGHDVICIPGPCAAITALVSSGLPTKRFCFEGFLPAKSKERKQRLKIVTSEERTTIIYESPHRLVKLLEELVQLCGKERPLQVARELTKQYEEQIGRTTEEVLKYFLTQKPIGECTLVLGGAPVKTQEKFNDSQMLNEMLALIANGASASESARELANRTGHSRRLLYSLLHQKEITTESN